MEADQQPVKENWVIFKNCGTVQNRDQFLTKRLNRISSNKHILHKEWCQGLKPIIRRVCYRESVLSLHQQNLKEPGSDPSSVQSFKKCS